LPSKYSLSAGGQKERDDFVQKNFEPDKPDTPFLEALGRKDGKLYI
jgi:hypothetical protein